MQLDPFLRACRKWWESFEEKVVLIIQGNIELLHIIKDNLDKLVEILNQDFGLMDEVHTWGEDFQEL